VTSEKPAGLWTRGESSPSRAAVWALSALLVLALAAVAYLLVGSRPNPADGVRALLAATAESDEAGYARMSERYRDDNELTDFRRALARVSEVRSATTVSPVANLGLFDRPPRAEFCSDFGEVLGEVRAHVAWEDGEWFVDALAVEDAELDAEMPAEVRCGPLR